VHDKLIEITDRIIERSRHSRANYLQRMALQKEQLPPTKGHSCGNLAHTVAAVKDTDKASILGRKAPNIGIVSAYNDMLSAHKPYEDYPKHIRQYARELGATSQVSGMVPAMCDGVTQGQVGMQLSLFSRDVIAMATAVSLSHNVYDGAICLGICDKIVPGLLIGSLQFGHLPVMFIPAGPMSTGQPNKAKARVRQAYATGKATREELQESECKSYHGEGTCTFYGTANSNQMLLEIMGLQLPSSSFVHPYSKDRDSFNAKAMRVLVESIQNDSAIQLADIVSERAIVNGMVGLLHQDVKTIMGDGLDQYKKVYELQASEHILTTASGWKNAPDVIWTSAADTSGDDEVLRKPEQPFSEKGGLTLLKGNLGRAVIKSSAVKLDKSFIEAPARVFRHQHEFTEAFKAGELERDFVAVLRFQGPKTDGMPELHQLTPALGSLLDKGFNVALVTDGRMSGASGKVPAAIHLVPEAADGGNIARIQDGDIIRLDWKTGELELQIDDTELAARPLVVDDEPVVSTLGQTLFQSFRDSITNAEKGATTF
jgi:phosphogluconate dehydratase